jgi:prepilin-type N-terminal cleavage/methylation domain-containing protein
MNRRLSKCRKKRNQRGFSLTEIVIVVLVILIVAAISIPNMVKAWYDSQLRTCAFEISDLIQQARMYATKQNKTVTVRFQVNNGVTQAYIDVNNNGSWDPNANPREPIIDLGRQFTMAAGAPGGSGGNPTSYVLPGDSLNGTPCDNTCTLGFSSRGLPCSYISGTPGTCSTPAANYFVYYIQDGQSNGWGAVSVSKAGRSNGLLWNGTSWN